MGNIKLHFPPPYSPEHNPIKRLWGELHTNVTRNHRIENMNLLMEDEDQLLGYCGMLSTEAIGPFPSLPPIR